MLDFCIIGSGISGSTIAHYLKKKYSINVHDKARGVGGRSSFKRYKGKIFIWWPKKKIGYSISFIK